MCWRDAVLDWFRLALMMFVFGRFLYVCMYDDLGYKQWVHIGCCVWRHTDQASNLIWRTEIQLKSTANVIICFCSCWWLLFLFQWPTNAFASTLHLNKIMHTFNSGGDNANLQLNNITYLPYTKNIYGNKKKRIK